MGVFDPPPPPIPPPIAFGQWGRLNWPVGGGGLWPNRAKGSCQPGVAGWPPARGPTLACCPDGPALNTTRGLLAAGVDPRRLHVPNHLYGVVCLRGSPWEGCGGGIVDGPPPQAQFHFASSCSSVCIIRVFNSLMLKGVIWQTWLNFNGGCLALGREYPACRAALDSGVYCNLYSVADADFLSAWIAMARTFSSVLGV